MPLWTKKVTKAQERELTIQQNVMWLQDIVKLGASSLANPDEERSKRLSALNVREMDGGSIDFEDFKKRKPSRVLYFRML